jgi:hypothetical protein
LASEDIHALEVAVDSNRKEVTRLYNDLNNQIKKKHDLEACLSFTEKKVDDLRNQLKESNKVLEDYIRRAGEDESGYKEEIQDLKDQINNLESVAQEREFVIQANDQQLKLITSELSLVKTLLKEEREEAKATREMIYLRTGMKREVFASSEEVKEVKEERATTAPPKTRSQIKNQLEARASRLLREQKQKEDDAINNGQLPPAESTTH